MARKCVCEAARTTTGTLLQGEAFRWGSARGRKGSVEYLSTQHKHSAFRTDPNCAVLETSAQHTAQAQDLGFYGTGLIHRTDSLMDGGGNAFFRVVFVGNSPLEMVWLTPGLRPHVPAKRPETDSPRLFSLLADDCPPSTDAPAETALHAAGAASRPGLGRGRMAPAGSLPCDLQGRLQ